MAAEKSTFEATSEVGTTEYTVIVNETKNGLVYHFRYSIDYSEEYEAPGFTDVKGHQTTNQNVTNIVEKVEGQEPIHLAPSMQDDWLI